MYIRKLSFSPSISGQIDSYSYLCDYAIKATIGLKNGFFLTMGEVSNSKNAIILLLNSSSG